MPFSDQLGRRSRHRLVRPSRRDPAWPHHYQIMRSHWSQITDSDDPVPRSSTITANMSCPPQSRRKRPPGPTLISDHMFERVAELTEMPGRELQVHGSLKLAKSLHEAGLVDLSDC